MPLASLLQNKTSCFKYVKSVFKGKEMFHHIFFEFSKIESFFNTGEAVEESGAVALSIGLAPLAERKETWYKITPYKLESYTNLQTLK